MGYGVPHRCRVSGVGLARKWQATHSHALVTLSGDFDPNSLMRFSRKFPPPNFPRAEVEFQNDAAQIQGRSYRAERRFGGGVANVQCELMIHEYIL